MPSRRCFPCRATSACEPRSTRSRQSDDLAADEPTGDVGMDRPGRVERGLTAAERPRARLLLARGEERDQVERGREPSPRHPPAPTRRRRGTPPPPHPVAPRAPPRAAGRCRPGRSRSRSAASSSAAPARPEAPRVVGEDAARVDVREDPLQLLDLCPEPGSPDFACFVTRSSRFSTWSRSATSSSSLNVSRSSSGAAPTPKPRSTTSSASTCRSAPNCAGPGTSCDPHRRRRHLARLHDLREPPRRSSAIGAMPTFVFPYSPPPALVSAVKSDRLPAARRADDPDL